MGIGRIKGEREGGEGEREEREGDRERGKMGKRETNRQTEREEGWERDMRERKYIIQNMEICRGQFRNCQITWSCLRAIAVMDEHCSFLSMATIVVEAGFFVVAVAVSLNLSSGV